MIRYAKIPSSFPLSVIQEEVRSLSGKWQAHLNTAHYEGSWTVLSLRAPGGDPRHIAGALLGKEPYADTPLLDHAPGLKSVLDSLPCPVAGARLLQLSAGSVIREHRDEDLSFEKGEARLHFPIFTHPGVDFALDGERLCMQEGECWYINAHLPHRVTNGGPSARIHLVVDCTVNEALKALFAQSDCHYAFVPVDEAEQTQIIRQLRLLGTETAHGLADQMEQQLGLDH